MPAWTTPVAGPSGPALHRGVVLVASWRECPESPVLRDRPFIEAVTRRGAMGAARRSPVLRDRPFIEAARSTSPWWRLSRSPVLRDRPFIEAVGGVRVISGGGVAGPSGPAPHRGIPDASGVPNCLRVAGPSGPALHRGSPEAVVWAMERQRRRRSFGTGPSSRPEGTVGPAPPSTRRRSFGTGPSSRLDGLQAEPAFPVSPVLRDRPFIEAWTGRPVTPGPVTVAGPSGPALHRGSAGNRIRAPSSSRRRSFGTGPSSRPGAPGPGRRTIGSRRSFGTGPSSRPPGRKP